jgi:hypothetical protein
MWNATIQLEYFYRGRTSGRQRATVNYDENYGAPEDTPLMAKLVAKELPGLLLISNMCFVEDTKRVNKTDAGMVIVATDSQEMRPIVEKLKRAKKVVVSIPFQDSIKEDRYNIENALHLGVAAVQKFWGDTAENPVIVVVVIIVVAQIAINITCEGSNTRIAFEDQLRSCTHFSLNFEVDPTLSQCE